MSPVEVSPLSEPLALLEEALRDGEPVPTASDRLCKAVETGDIEVLAARADTWRSRPRLPPQQARRQGIGRTLLIAADERCTKQDISYVEVQVEENGAETFYTALGHEPEPGVQVLSRSLPISNTKT